MSMTILIQIRNLIASLLGYVGLSATLTTALANVSLVAIAFGLVIASPSVAVITAVAVLVLLGLRR